MDIDNNIYRKNKVKNEPMTGLEPAMFCSEGKRDNLYTTPACQ